MCSWFLMIRLSGSAAGGLPSLSCILGLHQALEQAMPELAGKQAFYDVIVAGLEQRKLMGGSIHGMVTEAGIWAQRSTPFGREFLSFIAKVQTPKPSRAQAVSLETR